MITSHASVCTSLILLCTHRMTIGTQHLKLTWLSFATCQNLQNLSTLLATLILILTSILIFPLTLNFLRSIILFLTLPLILTLHFFRFLRVPIPLFILFESSPRSNYAERSYDGALFQGSLSSVLSRVTAAVLLHQLKRLVKWTMQSRFSIDSFFSCFSCPAGLPAPFVATFS
mmetsp:Transcript_1069/g.1418  ORF Transcript_1069/g.1418 Transcript_1069/m.1418 type:complete len:173 (-) Transcript_1069:132-650(-)